MKYILETERLALREFTVNDSEFIIELVNSPDWIKFIGDRKIKTDVEAKAYIENGPIKSYRENGFGLSLVEIKTDGTKIGMCGIIKRHHLDNPDIGFAFLPQFTGKGFAFEIANATLTYATTKLNLPKISAITIAANIKSIRLIEKIGMTYIKTFCFPNNTEELLLYNN